MTKTRDTASGSTKKKFGGQTKLEVHNTGMTVTGNISATGTVDGRDVAADGTKLDTVATSSNNYVHPTGAGNNHIPTGGSANQVLTYSSSGVAAWADAAGGDINIVDDTSPQLGGNLASNSNNVVFADNDKAIFGAGSDFQIYHSGSDNMIEGVADEYLFIKHDNLLVRDLSNKDQIRASNDAAVTLYYNGANKISTTNTGVAITGTVAATSYTGDGSNLTGVGGSTTWGAVGTYTVASGGSSMRSANSTISGSTLKTNAYSSGHKRPLTHEWNSGENSTLGVSGTWRNMTGAAGSTQFGKQVNCLWVRIS